MNISRIRKARGLTQIDLAELMGVTQPSVSRLEKGDDGCTLGLLRQCATALRVPLSDLFSADRTPAESQLLAAFRSLSPDRQQGWIDIAQAVFVSPPEAGPETHRTARRSSG